MAYQKRNYTDVPLLTSVNYTIWAPAAENFLWKRFENVMDESYVLSPESSEKDKLT